MAIQPSVGDTAKMPVDTVVEKYNLNLKYNRIGMLFNLNT